MGFFDAKPTGSRVAPVAPNMGTQAPAYAPDYNAMGRAAGITPPPFDPSKPQTVAATQSAPNPLSGYTGGGLGVANANVSFNPDTFKNSTAYNFIANEGMEGLGRSKAAQGLLNAPGTLKDYAQYLQGNAATFWNQDVQNQLQLAGINAGIGTGNANRTLSGLSSLSQLGLDAAGGQANYLSGAGYAAGGGTRGSANAVNAGMGAVGNTLADYFARKRAQANQGPMSEIPMTGFGTGMGGT